MNRIYVVKDERILSQRRGTVIPVEQAAGCAGAVPGDARIFPLQLTVAANEDMHVSFDDCASRVGDGRGAACRVGRIPNEGAGPCA